MCKGRGKEDEAILRDINRIPSMDERIQLSYDIFKIDSIKMGRVLTIIEAASPNALNKRASEDEVLINLDAMSPACFHEVAAFVQSCIALGASKSKKKRPATTESTPAGTQSGSQSAPLAKKKSSSR